MTCQRPPSRVRWRVPSPPIPALIIEKSWMCLRSNPMSDSERPDGQSRRHRGEGDRAKHTTRASARRTNKKQHGVPLQIHSRAEELLYGVRPGGEGELRVSGRVVPSSPSPNLGSRSTGTCPSALIRLPKAFLARAVYLISHRPKRPNSEVALALARPSAPAPLGDKRATARSLELFEFS